MPSSIYFLKKSFETSLSSRGTLISQRLSWSSVLYCTFETCSFEASSTFPTDPNTYHGGVMLIPVRNVLGSSRLLIIRSHHVRSNSCIGCARIWLSTQLETWIYPSASGSGSWS